MDFRILVLLYTYQCTSKCDICTFSCSPERNEKMNKDFAQNIITQAKDNHIFLVGFAGGEPFLFKDEILEMAQYVKKLGMQSTVTSNCFWATSYEEALVVVKEMQDVGISHLKISADDFHSVYVPYDNIKNVLMASKNLHFKVAIGCTSLKDSGRVSEMLKHIEDYSLGVNLIEQTCYPLGRAAEKFDADRYIYNYSFGDYCREQGYLTVTPDEKIYPCGCMCGMVKSREIKYTNAVDLKQVLDLAKSDKHVQYIAQHGITPYIKYIKEHDIPIQVPLKSIDTCHLCYELFSNEKSIPYLDEILVEITKP